MADREMMAAVYWRASRAARHPIPELAMTAQGTLWYLATGNAAMPSIRRAAMGQLESLGLVDKQQMEG